MGQSPPIRVLLIDDQQPVHDVVTQVLKTCEDIILVGRGFRGEDSLELCRVSHPDVVLMDVVLPGMNGAEATRLITREFPEIKVLTLSSFQEYEYIKAMLENGARGYVVKDAIIEDLVNTIRTTFQGNAVLSPQVIQIILQPPAPAANDFKLTARERQILSHMAQGLNNGQIAHVLRISQPTVRFHVTNILLKMGVETRSEALILGAKNYLV